MRPFWPIEAGVLIAFSCLRVQKTCAALLAENYPSPVHNEIRPMCAKRLSRSRMCILPWHRWESGFLPRMDTVGEFYHLCFQWVITLPSNQTPKLPDRCFQRCPLNFRWTLRKSVLAPNTRHRRWSTGHTTRLLPDFKTRSILRTDGVLARYNLNHPAEAT
jgi:hypothetical protein